MNTQMQPDFQYDISTGEYRVYVACLASYNEGHLYGQWMNVDADLHDNIQAMLENSSILNAEEWAIHDYELPFEISEYPNLDELIAKVDAYESLDDNEREGYAAYLEAIDATGTVEQFRDAYQGHYDSEIDYAYQYVEDTGMLDNAGVASNYFDYDSFARDLFMDLTFENGHVFGQ